ncbi:D-2-hydroxyacid dehydrogenase [Sorangium sp. So ce1099]|uniref:D-2-hydroxyacid dehydrogenase n=1 Tax=Sorangium sp. So ce1099 TaxID=3133331 RepID=UPI003F5E8F6D
MADAPVTLLLNAEIPAPVVSRLRAVSPRVRVVTAAQHRARPEWLAEAEVLLTSVADGRLLGEARALRWVQTLGAGVDWALTPEVVAREELVITNASGIHAQPIAEHIFGLILMFGRNLHLAALRQRQGEWRSDDLREGLRMLSGSTLGVLGVGAIGERTGQIGAAFGMRTIGVKRTPTPVAGFERIYGVDELHAFLAESDYVVNALPLTPATRGIIGPAELAAMKSSAILINIGRGGTIQTDALVDALRSRRIAGAGLDVTDPEPLPREHPLWRLENVLLTPHYSGAHPGYSERASEIFLENLSRYLDGRPLINVVDKRAGY